MSQKPDLCFINSLSGDRSQEARELQIAQVHSHAATVRSRSLKARFASRSKNTKRRSSPIGAITGLNCDSSIDSGYGSDDYDLTKESPWPGFGGFRTDIYLHIPHEGRIEVLKTIDFYSQHVWPNNELVCQMLNVTNVFSHLLMMMSDTLFFPAALATMKLLDDDLSIGKPSPLMWSLKGQAMKQVQDRLRRPHPEQDDALILAITFLASQDRMMNRMEDHYTHQQALARLVAARGGFDEFLDGTKVKGFLVMCDSTWILHTNRSVFATPYPHVEPSVIASTPSISSLPSGFQSLHDAKLVSPSLLPILHRFNTLTTLPSLPTFPPPPAPSRPYDDFVTAFPPLASPTTTLAKLLACALMVYCTTSQPMARISTYLFTTPRHVLTIALPMYEEQSWEEREAVIWCWMVALDAWRTHDSGKRDGDDELHKEGQDLLRKMRGRFPKTTEHWQSLEMACKKFFWTDILSEWWQTRWERIIELPAK